MATQQAYHAYAQQSKGTLMPGQTISVNKYTVQVERYLSQGGFAQVYLVRTQAPVYNTTHHVLKHVVVANESMLTEVKKEVDVMRLLRGHSNIVYLIDAAWAKMPTGAFEVYILMEYCPGGGIIDMMNRRLRERLTEAEILQIFVDVCEGVAHMHNSRPPLLHRDLKVENILQSSSTSYKLCDFGSTATVSKPPANSQEIRAVEADLNRHTTLQYRAPEMIDLHSRRPIDEKSDVWALGVLFYKLCYYTTPFEEHGPLAILNVQYRFPSYPIYSQQMMHLISSMLREHGAQRPTVFEVLAHVHGLRGTKSAYKYPLPTPTPLSPRHSEFRSNPLDGVITYRQPGPQSHPPSLQPLSKVQLPKPTDLALPPERRGRPKPSVRENASPSPSKLSTHEPTVEKAKLIDSDFGTDGNTAWSSAIVKNTLMVSQGNTVNDDAWNIDSTSGIDKAPRSSPLSSNAGFNDDFAKSLWISAGSSTSKPLLPTPSPRPQAYSPKIGPLPRATLAPDSGLHKANHEPQIHITKERDAFEGLGLMTPVSKPAPTLGEARKLRTGLAIMSTNAHRPIRPSPSPRLRPKTHTPRVSPISPPRPLELEAPWPPPRPTLERATSSAETRFPSLEELDATFSPPSSSFLGTPSKQESKLVHQTSEPPTLPPRPVKVGNTGSGTSVGLLKPTLMGQGANGTRSEQVTGAVARGDYLRRSQDDLVPPGKRDPERGVIRDSPSASKPEGFNIPRQPYRRENKDAPPGVVPVGGSSNENKYSPSHSLINHAARSKDLLTGDDEHELPVRHLFDPKLGQDIFKIRESPSKRASVIERNDVLEGTIPQQGHAPSPPAKGAHIVTPKTAPAPVVESPTVSRFMKAFPALDTPPAPINHSSGLTEDWSPIATTHSHDLTREKGKEAGATEDSSSEEDGPEEPIARSSVPSKATGSQRKHKGRQSSVHDLVDLWGGGVANIKEKQPESSVPLPAPFRQNTGATKSKAAYLPPRTSSPPRKSSPLTTGPQSHSPLTSRNEKSLQVSAGILPSPSPKSGRPRPQSLFIFPSKSNDSSSPPSTTLLPPEDPKPRSGRRTSISDMVQRYEAIQANAKVSGNAAPPSPVNVTKPVSLTGRDHIHDSTGPRPAKPPLDKIATALPGLGAPSTGAGDPVKRKTSLTVHASRAAFSSQRTSPVPSTASKSVSGVQADADIENIPPRSRNTSVIRPEPVKLPIPARKPVLSMEEVTKQSQPDQLFSTPGLNPDRSPSPDRPYQGVGKLIDQWQRKSAEAEASRNAILSKRTSLAPPKRAGLAPNAKGT